MPSGPKKRKAAKKKKEIQSSSHQGENELKSVDEKGSDGDSPAYRNNDDHNQFNEGSEDVEEIEVEISTAVGAKSLEGVGNDGKNDEGEVGKEGKEVVDVIEWDMKSDESCENKDVSVVQVESEKELGYGNRNNGGSNDVIETSKEKNLKDEDYSDSVKEKDVFDEAVNSVKESANSVAESSLVQVESEKESNYGNQNNGGSNDVIETGTVKNLKDESYSDSVKEKDAFDEAVNSVKESVNSLGESSVGSVNAVTSVSEGESGDTGSVILERSLGSRVEETDFAGKRNEDKVLLLPDEDVRTSSLVDEPETREFDGKVSSPVSQSPTPESTNGVERVKDSNTAESSGNQPPVTSAPLIVQKTSWLSCCGLFDVLSGSNR